jgi:chromate transporter
VHILWDLFATFFKIGAFTFGGGQAMIPIIQHEVCNKKKWVPEEEIIDVLVLAQSAPGVIAVNSATLIGYRLMGIRGALAATLGVVLPSFIIILLLANVIIMYSDTEIMTKLFTGIRAMVVALISVAVYRLGKASLNDLPKLSIAIIVLVLALILDINPIWFIISGGIIGIILYKRKNNKESMEKEEGQ